MIPPSVKVTEQTTKQEAEVVVDEAGNNEVFEKDDNRPQDEVVEDNEDDEDAIEDVEGEEEL